MLDYQTGSTEKIHGCKLLVNDECFVDVVSLIQPNRLNGWFCEVFFMQVDEQYLRYHGCPLWLTVGPTEDLDDFFG
jgi:hypothetical protein